MNSRYRQVNWAWVLAIVLAACGDDSGPGDAGMGDAGPCGPFMDPITEPTTDTWDNYAQSFFATYCTRCHSSMRLTPTERSGAPGGLDWDLEAVVAVNERNIRNAVGVQQFMPPSDPKPACEERRRLVRWIDNGLP